MGPDQDHLRTTAGPAWLIIAFGPYPLHSDAEVSRQFAGGRKDGRESTEPGCGAPYRA